MKYKEIKDENGKVIAANYYIEKDGVTYWEQIGETHAQFEARVNGTGYTANKVKQIMQSQINGVISVQDAGDKWHMQVAYNKGYAKPVMFWEITSIVFKTNGVNYEIDKTKFKYYNETKN